MFSPCVRTCMYIHIHTCIITFLNHLKTNCGHYAPLVLNISEYISLDQGHFTYITTVQLSKSAFNIDKTVGPILPMPSFKFHRLSQKCPFTIKMGAGGWSPGSNPRSPFALIVASLVPSSAWTSFSVSSMTLTFSRVQLWYFVVCLSFWVCLFPLLRLDSGDAFWAGTPQRSEHIVSEGKRHPSVPLLAALTLVTQLRQRLPVLSTVKLGFLPL